MAQTALTKLKSAPNLFESVAQEESACSSAKEGGRLGQISRGQTMPAFENALFMMTEGEMCAEPVATEVGYHIIKVQLKLKQRVSQFVEQSLHGITQPPSIASTCPVIYEAAGESRNATAGATSSGVPKRRIAIASVAHCRSAAGMESSSSVSI